MGKTTLSILLAFAILFISATSVVAVYVPEAYQHNAREYNNGLYTRNFDDVVVKKGTPNVIFARDDVELHRREPYIVAAARILAPVAMKVVQRAFAGKAVGRVAGVRLNQEQNERNLPDGTTSPASEPGGATQG